MTMILQISTHHSASCAAPAHRGVARTNPMFGTSTAALANRSMNWLGDGSGSCTTIFDAKQVTTGRLSEVLT